VTVGNVTADYFRKSWNIPRTGIVVCLKPLRGSRTRRRKMTKHIMTTTAALALMAGMASAQTVAVES